MAFGNKDCVYEGFKCGEQHAVHSTSYSPQPHESGLIREDGMRGRDVNLSIGTRVAFTVQVSGDTDRVRGEIKSILNKHKVEYKVKDWEKHPNGNDKTITFYDISSEPAQLDKLRKAVTEISKAGKEQTVQVG